MDSKIPLYTKTFKDTASIPAVTSATILPNPIGDFFCIRSTWKAEDYIKMEKVSFSREFVVRQNLDQPALDVISQGMPFDYKSPVISAFSNSGKKQAIVTEKGSSDSALFIEIWNESTKEATFDLSDKEHGKIFNNANFGVLKWSSDDQRLLYVAEAKEPKSVSYFKESAEKKEDESAEKKDDKTIKGEEFLHREGWGEQLVGSHHTVLCVLEVSTGKVEVLPTDKCGDISVGKAIWGPDDKSIIFVGWDEKPFRFGLAFCNNRRSAIYSINEDKEMERISAEDQCSFSPVLSPNQKTLFYVENDSYGPHKMYSTLQKYDFQTKIYSTAIPVVNGPVGDSSPGVCNAFFPRRCWSCDGRWLIFVDVVRSREVIMCYDTRDGSLHKVRTDDVYGECTVLDVHNDVVVAVVSTPNTAPCLVAGFITFHELGKKNEIEFKFIPVSEKVHYSDITWEIASLRPTVENKDYPDLDYEVIIMKPAELQGKLPLIVLPHGGPHNVYTASFIPLRASFIKLGYMLCLVNYRGSLGFGSDSVKSLPSNVGMQDVADCQNAAVFVKNKFKENISDVFVLGGSHGGFLGAHLIGQFPDFYKAAVLLNPVIDISGMIESTDIPDWCWVESGGTGRYDPCHVIKPESLQQMFEKSPIRYAENIVAPTLLLVGQKDLRVPPKQGMKLHRLLKAREVPTKLFVYDDNHTLGKTPHLSDVGMQVVLWFEKYGSSNCDISS